MTYPPGRDLIEAPPLGNVGLSHNYCDWGAIDLTLHSPVYIFKPVLFLDTGFWFKPSSGWSYRNFRR